MTHPNAILHFTEFFKNHPIDKSKPWLICGKGPSFSKKSGYDLNKFNILAINETNNHVLSLIAFYTDYEGWTNTQYCSSRAIMMPFWPHFDGSPHERKPLPVIMQKDVHLRASPGMVYFFDLDRHSSIGIKGPSDMVLTANSKATEAAFMMLGLMGFKKIFTLGVDGGIFLDELFGESNKTNGNSYDTQFEFIKVTCQKFGIEWECL